MIQRTCPVCGHELVFKSGRYGQFIGCSNYPDCTFTMNEDGTPTQRKREVEEWDENGKPTSYSYLPIIKAKPIKKCPYDTCNGSGLLPFTLPNGTLSKHAKVFCECHNEYDNPYLCQLKPEDFDFPMSDTFRGWTYQHCGVQDPRRVNEPQFDDSPPAQVFKPRLVDKEIKQLTSNLVHLRNMFNEHIDKAKARSKYT